MSPLPTTNLENERPCLFSRVQHIFLDIHIFTLLIHVFKLIYNINFLFYYLGQGLRANPGLTLAWPCWPWAKPTPGQGQGQQNMVWPWPSLARGQCSKYYIILEKNVVANTVEIVQKGSRLNDHLGFYYFQ